MKAIFNFVNNTCSLDGNVSYNADKTIAVIVSNGTSSASDVLNAYEQYNDSCMSHIEGVCAFCIWDSKRNTLLVVRDKIGEKSLYYAQLPTSLIVASSLSDILPYITYPSINPLNLAQPIRYNFPIDLQQTWIEQIRRVRAGEALIVDPNGIRSTIYWKRDHTPSYSGTKQEALFHTLELLRQSVRRCVETAEGPVAVLLSGGIDSTSLAILTKEIQQEVHVICAGYKGNQYQGCDERTDACRFAVENGLIYHEVELDVNDFQNYLNELMPHLDEPCFDINCMVQYALYKKAAKMGFKTVLAGLGGDEQFYSYTYHHRIIQALQLRQEFNQLYPIRKHWKEYIRYVFKNYKHLFLPNHPVLMNDSIPMAWTYADYKRFSADAILSHSERDIRFNDIDVHYSFPEYADINTMYEFMFSSYMTTLCIYMANKAGEANGVEVRYPFLSSDLVTFVDSLPLEMKFDINQPKRFQKEMMKNLLPDYILNARKRGFEPPFEFIRQMATKYHYRHIQASYCWFNSMVADQIIDNMLYK